MDPTQFDAFTKALATPNTRRQALRRIGGTLTGLLIGGGALTGGLRAFLFPGHTQAAGGGNSACANFCSAVFGGDTPAQAQCASDAAHHTGLCYTCGPASPGGTKSICCPQNPNGTCTSYSSATCCASGQVCQNGTCVTPTTTTTAATTTTTTTIPTTPPPTMTPTAVSPAVYTGITPWG